jgi:hypothetical protein
MARRKPKRLKTGDHPDEEVVMLKVRVKVESDNDKEEESLDDDAEGDKEEKEQPPAQPVGRIERPAYVAPRPNYILMDYDKSMFETVIPENKVIIPINCWCYTNLDHVDWGENSIDRCPTYGVCQVCCSSGPTGRRCVKYETHNVIYVCTSIVLKDDKGVRISHRSNDKVHDMQTTREQAIGRLCEEVQELSRQHGTKHGVERYSPTIFRNPLRILLSNV